MGAKLGLSLWGEKHRLRVFENSVLRKIFGPKREEDRWWRKLHNDELRGLYSSPNFISVIKSRRMRWAVHVVGMGRGEVFTGFWLGGLKLRDHWGRTRRRWGDKIKMDLREIWIDGVNWIRLAQDRVQWRAFVNTV
jgi:hypothetical protein